MPTTRIDLSERGTQEPQVGLFYAMMQELRQRTIAAAADLTPSQLSWKPRPGDNAIGELLLHIAEAELWWIKTVGTGEGMSEEEMQTHRTEWFGKPEAPPLPERPLSWYVDLLREARRYSQGWYTSLSDLSLAETRPYTDEDGKHYEFTLQWVLYHLLEHEAGHRAQILSLRRQIEEQQVQ